MTDLRIPDADVFLFTLPCESYFDRLKAGVPWEQRDITIYGKSVKQPRLTAWYGDPDASYSYSGTKHVPLPWSDLLLEIKRMVENEIGVDFNSVLLNYYRDGRDSIGFHSDDERELGSEPIIASLSFGASRRFVFKHRRKVHSNVSVDLGDCSLLVMMGKTQQNWMHGIEKVANAGERINMTFRFIREA